MIDQLLTLSREIGGDLYDFLSRDEVLSDSVSGAMIGMDRFWLESVFCEYFWPHPAYKYYAQRSCLTFESEWHLPLDYTPPTWEAHCKVMGYSQGSKPIYIRVILRNAKSLWQENKPTEFRGYPL